MTFPFFAPSFIEAKDNDLPLFRRVFHPAHEHLYFVGLLQPLGAIMPLAEAQGAWIAKHLLGEYRLPSAKEIQKDIAKERKTMFARYVKSKRHTMQVDFDDYLVALREEVVRGQSRAKKAGFARSGPA